jgi:hypothetical protein
MTEQTKQAAQRDREVQRTAGRKMVSPFATSVVGVSFVPKYPGNLHALSEASDRARLDGEPLSVVLVRNPKNQYDSNAIEVHVPALGEGGFIGHLTRPIAARMAPEIDAGETWIAEVGDVLINPAHMDRPGITINCKRID